MHDHNEPDLDWLAFQYVADELSPDEAAEFELRLADDQAARKAVAQAVEISQAAAAAFELEPAKVTPAASLPARWSALWWMACGAAACLAAVAAFHVWPRDGSQSAASPDLARAWSQARDHVPAAPDLASEVLSDSGELAEIGELDPHDHATPSWLMAALSDDDMDGTPAMEEEMMQTPPGKKGEG